MKSVFIITDKSTGSCGHGLPGEGYITLRYAGSHGEYGNLEDPAFIDRASAEKHLSGIDCWGKDRLEILEIPVIDE